MEKETDLQNAENSEAIDLPLDWRQIPESSDSRQKIETPGDALWHCIQDKGIVDIEYIAALCNFPPDLVIHDLGNSIWQNPETWDQLPYQGWEMAEEYLSGHILHKLMAAKDAVKTWPDRFKRNVKALQTIMPQPIPEDQIFISLRSPWMPDKIINRFCFETFDGYSDEECFSHDPVTGTWLLPDWRVQESFNHNRRLYSTYGTRKCNAIKLMEKTLNHKQIKDTQLLEKQRKLEDAFQKWLKNNPDKKQELCKLYFERFGYIRKRAYNGDFIKFPGMTRSITLYPHQRNAVARILMNHSTLLAHNVGAGKTFTMIAAAMELKRLGKSTKNLFIVPNNIIGQWGESFKQLYPKARVLVIEPGKDFTPKKRINILSRIKQEDFDGIIMPYSCIDLLPLSLSWQIEALSKEIRELDQEIEKNRGNVYIASFLKNLRKKKWGAMDKLHTAYYGLPMNLDDKNKSSENENESSTNKRQRLYSIPQDLCFDKLGITGIFLDEAHNYKNIPLETRMIYVAGINPAGSAKCARMLAKCDYIHAKTGIVVLATGTPISNSISDVYNLQQFLQKGTLKYLGINTFDNWAGNFTKCQSSLELTVDSAHLRNVYRLSKFYNLPELSNIFNMVADYSESLDWSSLPRCDKREDFVAARNLELDIFIKSLTERANFVRKGEATPSQDNFLKISTDARKAALDMQILWPDIINYESKVDLCAKNVYQIWQEHKEAAQLVFCDLSVPKNGFNAYHKLRDLLIKKGIPAKEIACIHEASSVTKRDELYENVRRNKIRVIIGSTFKLGLGVNIQDRLYALHHLDAPWRPADMEQREGRILRAGNLYENVRILRYITDGSFDARNWQILETKQRFIASFLTGQLGRKRDHQLSSDLLSYAEIKALAIGNPKVKTRVEIAASIEKLQIIQNEWYQNIETTKWENAHLTEQISASKANLIDMKADLENAGVKPSNITRAKIGRTIYNAAISGDFSGVEKKLADYRNFEIYLRQTTADSPAGFWVKGQAQYFVPLGKTPEACMLRIDNFIEKLQDKINDFKAKIKDLKKQKEINNNILEETDEFSPKIAKLQKKLKRIDKELAEESGIESRDFNYY